MSEKRSLLALGEAPVLARSSEPLRHAQPIVAIVDRTSPKWAADAMARALEARGAKVARLVATSRTREGHEIVGEHVRASIDAMPVALASALTTLPSHDVLVVEGTPAVALLDTRFALSVAGASPLGLPPDVRALRSVFDLVLFAERPGVIERVAESVTTQIYEGQSRA